MKFKECKDTLDIILAIEGDELTIENNEELNKVIEICKDLSYSQGFYGRLYRSLKEFKDELDGYDLTAEFPLTI